MRRVLVVGALSLVVLLGAPRPTSAGIWAWLQELSGPGRFGGFALDLRLVCLGSAPSTYATAYAKAVSTTVLLDAEIKKQRDLHQSNGDLVSLAAESQRLQQLIQSRPQLSAASLEPAVSVLSAQVSSLAANFKKRQLASEEATGIIQVFVEPEKAFRENWESAKKEELVANRMYPVPGAAFTACSPASEKERRVSIGMVYRVLSATDEKGNPIEAYAGGNEIKLTTLGASVAFPVIRRSQNKYLDFVDAGFAISKYWFSSAAAKEGGFESFSGWMIDPIRFEVHAPSIVREKSIDYEKTSDGKVTKVPKVTKWLLLEIPYFQFGWSIFPAGFRTNAFGPNLMGDKAKSIQAHAVRNWNWGIDFEPIVRGLMGR